MFKDLRVYCWPQGETSKLLRCGRLYLHSARSIMKIQTKIQCGLCVTQKWVFGIYDTSTKRDHIQLVWTDTNNTEVCSARHYSDERTAYCVLAQLSYVNSAVKHSQNFVDPTTGTCTNAIEAYWSQVNKNI